MKRTISILLALVLILSFTLPAMAIEGEEETPLQDLPVNIDLGSMEIKDASEISSSLFQELDGPSKRDPVDDNLIFPGPLMEKCSFLPNQKQAFTVGILQTGKANQYGCILVYEGNQPKGDPVRTMVQNFETKKGYFTKSLVDYTNGFKPGRYTLVTCTAEIRGNSYEPIDGTAFMTDIYCYDTYQPRWSMFVQDPDTGERLDAVNVYAQETLVVALGRSPLPSDGSGGVLVTCDRDLVHIEEAGGYIFLSAKRCGAGTLTIIHRSEKTVHVPIYVCTAKGGHKPQSTVVALEPTVTEKGLSVNICKVCGTVYRMIIPSLGKTFENLKDIPQNAWYYSSVQEAVHRNLFNGVTAQEFRPDQAMTRAMLVTVLWRYENCPSGGEGQFTDVPEDAWFADGVNWAAGNGIVNGIGKGKFDPNGKITREQMAAILFRYAQKLELNMEADDRISSFVDGSSVSSWATDAMNWCVANGLIGGVKVGSTLYLKPQGDATRAQVCAILVRFIQSFSEPEPEVQYPDMTDALDGGEWEGLSWAFYEDGQLVVGGQGSIPNGDEIEAYPWDTYQDQITAVSLLYGVESVGKRAFEEYTQLSTLIMADSVHTIEEYAFFHCTMLSQMALSNNLISISHSAFEGCSSLTAVDLPYGLRQIGLRAFADCTALEGIILPDSITGYDMGKGLNGYHYGIGSSAFAGCVSLEYAYMPVAERTVAASTFEGCTALKEVVLPICVEVIEGAAFKNCSSLESISIMFNLTKITEGVFAHCTSLKEVYVFSEYYSVENNDGAGNKTEGDYPFGNPDRVTLYGFVDTTTERIASSRGYTFVDIDTLTK